MKVKHYDWTAHHAGARGDKVAIVDLDTGSETTYAELDQRASRLAAWMQSQGMVKGDRVAILAPNCPEIFETAFACAKIGVICLPLNWRLTVPELEYILQDSSPKLLINDVKFAKESDALVRLCKTPMQLQLDVADANSSYALKVANSDGDYQAVACNHDDVAMIMYTSGTTGHPKGAMITFGMNFYNAVNLGLPAGVNSNTVQLVVLPLFHTGGMNCYANPILHAGGRILLMRDFELGRALSVIGNPELGVTHFFGVPAPYQFMMQHPDFAATDLSRLQTAGVGGAPCAEAILRGWIDRGVALVQGWGMTETSPGGTMLEPEDAIRKIGSAGKCLLHTEVKIVDDDGNDLPWGEVGELLIRGPNITPGYWNNPEATAKSFVDDWLRTGDAARFDEEGFIYIVDRWKDMYISGGENVYPAEIENVLYQLPEVAEAAIIGIPDDRWGETGKAVVVVKPDQQLSADDVVAHCLKNLAKFKVPASVEFIDALPRNATGKVLKRNLRDQFVDASQPAIT